jgi:fatty acid-binding protein DegV
MGNGCIFRGSTLKYLALSGRWVNVAGMADTLNIKPILTVKDGKLVLLERIRTRAKAVERAELTTEAERETGGTQVIHVNNLEGSQELIGLLRSESPVLKKFVRSIHTRALGPCRSGAGPMKAE